MSSPINNSNLSRLQMAGYTICPVLLGQMSSAQWPLWPGNASCLPPYTPASQSSSPSMSLCATCTTAPCPTVHPRTTSSSTSAWAGRRRVQGKGHKPQASCVSFLLSGNAGQHTDLQHFLSLEVPLSLNYCYGGETNPTALCVGTNVTNMTDLWRNVPASLTSGYIERYRSRSRKVNQSSEYWNDGCQAVCIYRRVWLSWL